MQSRPPARRNIGILAHIDAGKTTVTEHLLHLGGLVRRPGAVDQGTTVSDWMVDEQERGITIASALATFQWRDVQINVVDTPGHVDFTIEVERTLRVLDGVVMVLSGPNGVQAQTETVWLQAARHGLPAIGLINKLDREGVDLPTLCQAIRDRLAIVPLPLQIPVVDGEDLIIIDVLSGSAVRWDLVTRRSADRSRPLAVDPSALGGALIALRHEALEAIVDGIASFDDHYAQAVLDGRDPGVRWHLEVMRKAVASRQVLPLICGVARLGLGIETLADAIVALLPDPVEREPKTFPNHVSVADVSLPGSGALAGGPEAGPIAAYVFKTEPRRRGTRLAFLRVFAGDLTMDTPLLRMPEGQLIGVAQLVTVAGADFEATDVLPNGSIGALAFGETGAMPATGDTLGDRLLPFTFERLRPPQAVLHRTVEATDPDAHERLIAELARLCVDDPSLQLTTDVETGRAVLAGMGELHLEVAVERVRRALGVELRSGRAQVRTRHVLTREGHGEAMVNHPTGRARVKVAVVVNPLDRLTIVVPETERAEWRDAIVSGLESAAGVDGRAVIQLLGARLTATSIESHGTDVVPVMLRDAAEWATLRAIAAAGTTAAEPWCALNVVVPDAAVGRVVGDLARRRARVRRTESRGTLQELIVEAPLGELIGYANDLASITAGRGQFTLEPIGYRSFER